MTRGKAEEGEHAMAKKRTHNFEIALAKKVEYRSDSLLKVFKNIDVNRDGHVTRSEFKSALRTSFGINLSKKQMDAIYSKFSHIDDSNERMINTSQSISFHEFNDYIHHSSLSVMNTSSGDFGCGISLKKLRKAKRRANMQRNKTHELETGVNAQEERKKTALNVGPAADASVNTLRYELQQKIQEHLFFMMKPDVNDHVSIDDFRSWVSSLGLVLSKEQCLAVVGSDSGQKGVGKDHFEEIVEKIYDAEEEDFDEVDSGDDDEEENESLVTAIANMQIMEAVRRTTDDAKSDQEILTSVANSIYSNRVSFVSQFKKLDKNNSGSLEVGELQAFFSDINLELSVERTKSLISKFDSNGEGSLRETDFFALLGTPMVDEKNMKNATTKEKRDSIKAGLVGHEYENQAVEVASKLTDGDVDIIMQLRQQMDKEALEALAMFEAMDTSNSKSVSVEQLKVCLMEKGIEVKPEHLDHIMKRFDPKKTGNLCYTQFLAFLISAYQ
eukprot:CAMPEP_0194365500 /NCGR_PEP_ID=MMETSP0174-20130528/13559_1 /TAXON_ID=216777 /ORGANISM="Proboscia alata, Strain PI-D3" /LENGTH=499 /DNA_ID=CAMNT_0039140227 /DNA_START=39 /DNA_END=1538 /DNA_ORIENTATION=-